MVNAMTPVVAAVRPRALSALESPFALSTCTTTWRVEQPSFDVPTGMRGTALGALDLNHNSIPAALRSIVAPTANVPSVHVGRDVYAAKQVAPPRGVPR